MGKRQSIDYQDDNPDGDGSTTDDINVGDDSQGNPDDAPKKGDG